MNNETNWTYTGNGERLDKAIPILDNSLSRMTVKRMIEEGKVLVNSKCQKASYALKNGDQITIKKEEPKEIEAKAENIPIEIVYEDNDIVVVNKPKGLVVHPR